MKSRALSIMKVNIYIIMFVVFLFFFSLSESGAECNKRAFLFKIERSKNKNIVRYDACLLQSGNISGSTPVIAYWILEKGGKEELSGLEEKHAYGVESKEKLAENRFRISIKAFKDREIIVQKLKAGYKALVRIGGDLSILEKVYVKSEDKTLGFPEVHYIELFGRGLRTNKPVKERITPS